MSRFKQCNAEWTTEWTRLRMCVKPVRRLLQVLRGFRGREASQQATSGSASAEVCDDSPTGDD